MYCRATCRGRLKKRKMKRIALSVTVILVLICTVSCGGSLQKVYPVDIETGTEADQTVIFVDPDWPYYEKADELAGAATDVFSGIVTGISFEIIDLMTGEPDRDPASDAESRMLYTVYTVQITECYKGDGKGQAAIYKIGGLMGYNMKYQYDLMEAAGLLGPMSNSIPVSGLNSASPAAGKEYLFCVKSSSGGLLYIVNPSQFVHDVGSSNAKAIIKACEKSAG